MFKVYSLGGQPSLPVLLRHIQKEYPEFWTFIFGGLAEQDLVLFLLAVVILEVFCVGILTFSVALCIKMPYHGPPPSAEELRREVLSGGWPDAPEEELPELPQLLL